MKRRFSKILGVGLTLALITSLLLVAAPVSAISQPTVVLGDATISKESTYTITFTVAEEIPLTGSIVIEFPEGTILDDTKLDDNEITVQSTAGFGALNLEIGVHPDNVDFTDETATITITTGDGFVPIGEAAMVRVKFKIDGAGDGPITNPSEPDDYTLTVSTFDDLDEEIEAAVTSAAYEIEVPDIAVLPGIVQLYNAAYILMDQDTGSDAINEMVDDAGENYTIVVGPGEYAIDTTILIDEDGVTLKSSAGAEDTIIVADAGKDAIQITADEVTVDGFTIQDTENNFDAIFVAADAADAIIQNNIFTAEDGWPDGIHLDGTGATVSGNEFDINNTMIVHGDDATLSDNIFGAGINLQNPYATALTGITITDNTIIGAELWGIILEAGATYAYTDVLIEGNTISETTEDDAIGIFINGIITNLQILGNDITDNEGVGILIDSDVTIVAGSAIAIKFNTITGNDADNDGYGIQNDSDDADVDAALNWWGTAVADDVADMVNNAGDGTVTYEPFLADTAEAVFSASEVAVGEDALDAKTTVGVRVSGATGATVIVVAKYKLNPQEAIAKDIAFYDVYVAGVTDPTITDVTIKFYAGDGNSTLWVWSADTEAWVDLSEDASFGFSLYGGYMYIDYGADLLDGTAFAVVAGEAVADELDTPEIVAPVSGDDTVSLTPIFAWEAVDDADGYYFEFADNANFVMPLVKLDGDMGRLLVTAYAYVGDLPYSTAYYWKVKAVSGTIEAGDLLESDWASAVFITKEEPVEPLPPVVIEPTPPAPPAPIITITQPDIIVPLPAIVQTPVTPGWIYAIIAVGAVLVISLLVLIIRTRRVA